MGGNSEAEAAAAAAGSAVATDCAISAVDGVLVVAVAVDDTIVPSNKGAAGIDRL